MENKYLINSPISIEEVDFDHINDNLPRYGEKFDYEEQESIWCIYIHVNKITNKKYVGISSNLKRRWRTQGIEYKRNMAFYDAIQKYTWDGFEHIVLMNGLTLKMAVLIEKELIVYFDSLVKHNGYNIAEGGAGVPAKGIYSGGKKEVFAYYPDGAFYKSWPLVLYALEELNGKTYDIIHQCCLGKKDVAYGFQWRDHYCGEKIEAIDPLKNKIYRNMPIVRISGDKQLTYYDDIYAVNDEIITERIIVTFGLKRHCTCGFLWYFVDEFDETKIDEYLKNSSLRCVYQFDLLGNQLNIFSSIQEAADYVGTTPENIAQACKRFNSTASGYQWRYSFDIDDIGEYHQKPIERRKYLNVLVYEISPEKEIVNIYPDIYSISDNKIVYTLIMKTCNGKNGHRYKGNFWFFEDSYLNQEYIKIIDICAPSKTL